MGTANLMGQGGNKPNLTGDAIEANVLNGKTFYKDNPEAKLTGTLALTGDTLAGDVLSGKKFYKDDPTTQLTGTIPSKGAATYTPGTTDQAIASGQYLSGAQTISGDADLVAGNIKNGVNIFGVTGTALISSGNAVATDVASGKTFSNASNTGLTGTALVSNSSNPLIYYYLKLPNGSDFTTTSTTYGADMFRVQFVSTGTYRVTFTLYGELNTPIARVYGDTTAKGTERSGNGTYTEDFNITALDIENKVMGIKLKGSTSSTVYLQNVQITRIA